MSHHNSDAIPLEDLVAQAKAALADNESTYSRFQQTRRQHWEDLIGPGVDELLENRALAMQYLNNPEPKHRIAALDILASHWKPDELLSAKCEEMALHDTDNQVRAVALTTLACCYQSSNNVRIGRMMADIVCDAAASDNVRIAAYRSLFRISGLPVDRWPDPMRFQFPGDVDWEFVKSFQSKR